jgi:dTDP-4-dehydrorhamnose reductase
VIEHIILKHPELSGMYHVSAVPISKYDLLVELDKAFSTGATIVPSDDVVIDRSLDSTAFRKATRWDPPLWAEMIAELAADKTPYDSFRATMRTAG